MGVLLSSCAPNFHSKISFLTENFKNFESGTVSSSSWVAQMNRNYEDDEAIYFNNTLENHWKTKKYNEINVNEDNVFQKPIRPKNMPRYQFSTLEKGVFINKTQAEDFTDLSVVLMHSTVLEGSNNNKKYLPLGTVLNVLYEEEDWLYVQTADGQLGYVDNKVCIPLEIFSLPSINDNETFATHKKNTLNVISSEKIINMPNFSNSDVQCTEKDFDLLYLRLTRNNVQSKKCGKCTVKAILQKNNEEQKTIILVIKTDYVSKAKDTLSVRKGDIVFLIHCCVKGWFWVKNKHNMEGFIPAATAGYWCV
ncbi:SH3 domain-containing protein Dlish-like [Planococcus citri]|uniref:SH3 domain-containing protein Dlish-like n=1 Tax=Planococcus citri TaxID=170843 RepID=UPI0031F95A5D